MFKKIFHGLRKKGRFGVGREAILALKNGCGRKRSKNDKKFIDLFCAFHMLRGTSAVASRRKSAVRRLALTRPTGWFPQEGK